MYFQELFADLWRLRYIVIIRMTQGGASRFPAKFGLKEVIKEKNSMMNRIIQNSSVYDRGRGDVRWHFGRMW